MTVHQCHRTYCIYQVKYPYVLRSRECLRHSLYYYNASEQTQGHNYRGCSKHVIWHLMLSLCFKIVIVFPK